MDSKNEDEVDVFGNPNDEESASEGESHQEQRPNKDVLCFQKIAKKIKLTMKEGKCRNSLVSVVWSSVDLLDGFNSIRVIPDEIFVHSNKRYMGLFSGQYASKKSSPNRRNRCATEGCERL
uniref:Uncharacterized protein n=1 Tax=Ditylenchus dipsaci TaxID=166011 RepID=A0A915E1Z0_9BILA